MIRNKIFTLSLVFFSLFNFALYSENRTFAQYGAIGDGVTDDTIAIQQAISQPSNEHVTFDGQGQTYLVSDELNFSVAQCTLNNAKFLQTATDDELQTIKKVGGIIYLNDIFIDRGNNISGGNITYNTGIWIKYAPGSTLTNVEVTGDGRGSGIQIISSDDVVVDNAWVHHMFWSWPHSEPVQNEKMFGIWIQNSKNVHIINSKVERLYGDPNNSGIFGRVQSDGITLSNTDQAYIFNTSIERTGEGIDFTGDVGNTNFHVDLSSAFDCHSFGFKFANSAKDGTIERCWAVRSGWAGFVFSGGTASISTTNDTQNIDVKDCHARDTGYQTDWPTQLISGFRIMEGDNSGYPTNIRIENCDSINGSEAPNIKEYGFHSQTPGNTLTNTNSSGHTVQGSDGF